MPPTPRRPNKPGKKIDVFISFSGARSRAVAEEIFATMKALFPNVEGFFSENIEGGRTAWDEVRRGLESANIGIICMTAENQLNPWILFEAGALSKDSEKSRVIPLLIDPDLKLSIGPLGQLAFKARRTTLSGIRLLMQDIIKLLDLPEWNKSSEALLRKRWLRIEQSLDRHALEASLAPKSLPRLFVRCWTIEHSEGRPFRKWLRNRVLDTTEKAVAEGTGDGEDWLHGPDVYRDEVRRQLKPDSPDPNMTVLALCGEKGFEPPEEDDYFRMFYTFAEKQRRRDRDKNRIRVCRVFVRRRGISRTRERANKRIITGHRERRGQGVLGLTVSLRRRKELDKIYPGISDRVDAGFGFLVFHTLKRTLVITHEGRNEDMAYSLFNSPLNISEILSFFESLCERSEEKKQEAKALKRLFERIRLSKRGY